MRSHHQNEDQKRCLKRGTWIFVLDAGMADAAQAARPARFAEDGNSSSDPAQNVPVDIKDFGT